MARRTPFPFRDHMESGDAFILEAQEIEDYIQSYEDALLVEYKSGDIDVASFHEGLRSAYEQILVDLLGIDQKLLDDYWGRGEQPTPPVYELPFTGGSPLIDYDQVEEWSGVRLNAEQWERLDEAIPHSSIPEAISVIVDSITKEDR
jgi:hypothetical protein